jgi:hypothetical protein
MMVILALGVASPAWAGGKGPAVQTVATGLDNPRHLEFGGDGDLFVAEAGRGGSGPCFVGAEGPACVGNTGAVTKIDRRGRQSRVVTGLASFAVSTPPEAVGAGAIGPHGIAVLPHDVLLVVNGGPTEPHESPATPGGPAGPSISRETLAAQNPVANLFGRVLLATPYTRPVSVADLYAYERDVNPDAQVGTAGIDSNPVDVEVDGLRLVVADAGGNTLNAVNLVGRISTLGLFPNRPEPNPFGGPPVPMNAVPTSVEVGHDGYYVSQLTGFPFPVGGANIYRVPRRGGTPEVIASGFTNIMDLALAPDGTLYVLEIDHDGLLGGASEGAIFARSRWGGVRRIELPAGALPMPGGIAIGRDGLYVTINTTSPGAGAVVRIKSR